MTREEKKEELIGLFSTGAIFIGDLIDECFDFADEHPVLSNSGNTGKDLIPDEETIKQVVALYKQWYSEQSDKPLPDYIEEYWKEESTDTAEMASNAFTTMMGDPVQDFNDIINEVLGKTEQLKND